MNHGTFEGASCHWINQLTANKLKVMFSLFSVVVILTVRAKREDSRFNSQYSQQRDRLLLPVHSSFPRHQEIPLYSVKNIINIFIVIIVLVGVDPKEFY